MRKITIVPGEVFGRLTVLKEMDGRKVRCRCRCGTRFTTSWGSIRNGGTRSCGCLSRERHAKARAPIQKSYGRLKVLKEVGKDSKRGRMILCRCNCGKLHTTNLSSLNSGGTKSCGCLHREIAGRVRGDLNRTHGLSGHPMYHVWQGMIRRCYNKDRSSYKNYGERGIIVCKRWHTFENFYNWIVESKWKEGLTIERRDNDRGYGPRNCELIPISQQSRNRRNVTLHMFKGERRTIPEIAEMVRVPKRTLFRLIHDRGLKIRDAVSEARIAAEMTSKGRLIQANTITGLVYGELHTMNSASKEFDIAIPTLRSRIRIGMTLEKAVANVLKQRDFRRKLRTH